MNLEPKQIFENNFSHLADNFDRLDRLARCVEEKSKVMNITAIREYAPIWQKHIIDSLMCTKIEIIESILKSNSRILDVGTGAGFPGLPLAICFENSIFDLMDATRKKLDVVNEFSEHLDIKNARTIWGRAEDKYLISQYKSAFDLVLARSVAFLPDLMSYSASYIKTGGYAVFYKNDSQEEKFAAENVSNQLGLKFHSEYKYTLDDAIDQPQRTVLIYQKI